MPSICRRHPAQAGRPSARPIRRALAGLALALAAPGVGGQPARPADGPQTLLPGARGPGERGPLRLNEPMYFIAGSGDGGASAKFQLSFAYRFFEADDGEGLLAWARDLQMAYTQTSVMDLSEKSLPFRDSSYRPSLFIDHRTEGAGLVPDYLRYGIEHESNGRDGPTNRSLNTVFAWPFWAVPLGERHLYLAPKLYAYLSKAKENANIQEYRGFADLYAAYGNPRGLLGRVVGRMGTTGRGSVQLDLSYPVREEQIPRLGGYLFLQVFSGYGETILGYDRSQAIQVRAGYAIIR